MFKRLAVAASVSALALMGTVSGSSAAPSSDGVQTFKVAKFKAPKPPKAIDWDAPAPAPGGGFSTNHIDWD